MPKPSKSIFFVKELIKRANSIFRANTILGHRKSRMLEARAYENKKKVKDQYEKIEKKRNQLSIARSYLESDELKNLTQKIEDDESEKLSAIERKIFNLKKNFTEIKTKIINHKNKDKGDKKNIQTLNKEIKQSEKEILNFKKKLKDISSEISKNKISIKKEGKKNTSFEASLKKEQSKKENLSQNALLSESIEELYAISGNFVRSNLGLNDLTEAKQIYETIMSDKFSAPTQHHLGESIFIKNTSTNLVEFGRIANSNIVKNNNEIVELTKQSAQLENDLDSYNAELALLLDKDSKNSRDNIGGASFFVSFADIISVLLCFFILFFAMGSLDNNKVKQLASTFSEQKTKKMVFNAYVSEDELEMLGKVKELVLDNVRPEDIIGGETKTTGYLLSGTDLFYPGEIELSEEGIELLKTKLQNDLTDNVKEVIVEGHTDDQEFSTFPEISKKYKNNLELSSARAIKVVEMIEKKFTSLGSNIGIRAYGSNRPLKPNTSDVNRAFNRRVVIKITKEVKKRDTSLDSLEKKSR